MTEDRKRIWAKSQLQGKDPQRFRRERARGVKETRLVADKFCSRAGRIDREALQHPEDLEDDHALAR